MIFKKTASMVLSLLAFVCFSDIKAVALDRNVADETGLNELFTVNNTYTTGVVKADIQLTSAITQAIVKNVSLYSDNSSPYTISAQNINIASGSSLTLQNIIVQSTLIFSSNPASTSSLLISDIVPASFSGVTLGSIQGAADIRVTSASPVYFNGDVSAKNFTSQGNININNVFRSNGFTQTGGQISFGNNNASVISNNVTLGSTKVIVSPNVSDASLSGNRLSVSGSDITVNEGSKFEIKAGTGNAEFQNVKTTANTGSIITLDGTNGKIQYNNGEVVVNGIMNVNGNTNFNSSSTNVANGNLNLNSTAGDIAYDADSTIKNTGKITVSGTANKVDINGGINNVSGVSAGDIEKDGSNTLNLNGTVYGNSLSVKDGTVNVNENANFAGNINIEGNRAEEKIVNVNVASGKKLTTSEGNIVIGSDKNYDVTTVSLKSGSELSGSNIFINAKVNTQNALISAINNIVIGKMTTLNVSDGATTIKANVISISNGANINIENGSSLLYESSFVDSADAHYNVDTTGQLTLATGKYTNAKYEGNGALLNNKGHVSLNNYVNFAQSSATGNGGAVYNDGSLIYMDNTKGVQFTENKADLKGGALYNTSDGIVYLGENAQFSLNSSADDGGALYNENYVYIGRNSAFTANKSSNNGGAIYNSTSGDVNLDYHTSFVQNSAKNGGAIYNEGKITANADAEYISNSAEENGGAIYNNGTYSTSVDGVLHENTIARARFDGNSAKNGGAVYNNSPNLTVSNTSFSNNKSTDGAGGAIYNATGTMVINDKTSFTNNQAVNGNGGAIYNGANLQVSSDVVFGGDNATGNSASKGGAIYNAGTLTTVIYPDQKLRFAGNRASSQGGALYNEGTINSGSMDGFEFTSNTVDGYQSQGGALYNNSTGNLTIKNTNFNYNSASGEDARGGAIYNEKGTIVLDENAVFIGNAANSYNTTGKGGAIYNNDKLTVTSSVQMKQNSSQGAGGAIYNASGATTTLENGVIIGGDISEYRTKSTPTQGNSAVNGGAIYNEGTINIANDSTVYFIGNRANTTDTTKEDNGNGGAIYNKSNVNFSTSGKNLIFYGNSAARGGAIYNDKASTGNVIIGDATFENNYAAEGSAIYNAANMTILNSNQFINNNGGQLIANEGNLTLEDGYILTGDNNAGGIFNKGEGIISVGYSDNLGAVLYVHDNGHIVDGSGAVNGAGLSLTGNSTINTKDSLGSINNGTIKESVFETNVGLWGGALYKSSSKDLTISKTLFSGNSTVHREGSDKYARGGAIYNAGDVASGGTTTINIDKDVIFTTNTTTGEGGAVYNGANGIINIASGYVMGQDTQGYSNIAEGGGGAIANSGELNLNADHVDTRSIYFMYQGGGYSDGSGNKYNGRGGALFLTDDSVVNTTVAGTVHKNVLSNAVFTNNESMFGGALYNNGSSPLIVDATHFSGNRGYQDGGAVYNTGELALLLATERDNRFVGNQAGNTIPGMENTGRGGAVYNTGKLSISNVGFSDSPSAINVFEANKAGEGGAIYTTGDVTVNGGVGFYNNEATAGNGGAIAVDGGSLTLDLSAGDIVFSQNKADNGSAILLKGGSLIIKDGNEPDKQHTVTFVDADPENGILAQTVSSTEGSSNSMTITGGNVNFLSDASGYGGTYYQTGGVVTVANKFLNITDSPIRTVTGGTFVLKDGAELMTDNLMISNVETDSNNSAKIIFNENKTSSILDVSAMYDNTISNNYFLYGNEDVQHKITLKAADVEINDKVDISQKATIGNANNTYAVRDLKLSNGAQLSSDITLYGGTHQSDVGAKLTFGDGSVTKANAVTGENPNIEIKGYNANVILDNSKDLTFGSFKNEGVAKKSTVSQSGEGTVYITDDSSEYKGTYNQLNGRTEFISGSKYFNSGSTTNVTGGVLAVDSGVEFDTTGTTVINVKKGEFETANESLVDLDAGVMTVKNKGTANIIMDGAKITGAGNTKFTSTGDIVIGTAQKLAAVTVGGNSGNNSVLDLSAATEPVTVSLINTNNEKGVGELGFAENAVIDSNQPITVTLADNTSLTFKNRQAYTSTVNVNTATSSSPDEWAAANGNITKENNGTVLLTGDVSGFHGTLNVKDGHITTANQFESDVKYDLSNVTDNSKALVTNVTKNNDIIVVGDVGNNKASQYNLTVQNDRGDINVAGDVNVANGSVATFGASTTNVNNLNIKDATVALSRGNMNVAGNVSMGSTFDMMSGNINTQNVAGNITLTNDSDYKIDVNSAIAQSDKVVVQGNLKSDVQGAQRTLTVSDINFITEPNMKNSIYNVFDVKGNVSDVKYDSIRSKTTPLAEYSIAPVGENGSYLISRVGFTPSAMAVPVALQSTYLSQLATYDAALGNIDSVMNLPIQAYGVNQYAVAEEDTMVYSPIYIPELDKGMWFRPYGHFESVPLKDGPDVSNQTYGALVGGETELKDLGNGFQGTLGGYVGYTGAHQSYNGLSNIQNGGVIGVNGAVYKGGFFSGLTVNANAGFNNASTAYGHNDFFMLSAGIASKTGYNWELARGKFIVQPSWLMSYTFANAFSPENLSIYNVDSKALHSVQLAPGIKLIANLPRGWQPYLMADFRFNIGDESNVAIGGVDLDNASVKPYVEYGLGMQKRWGDRFTGFGQFLARGGGRNGVGLNMGMRWNVGRGR